MIEIKEEKSQQLFGITNGCANCGNNQLDDDIKTIKITPKYGGSGCEIALCGNCRGELKELLGQ